jgi:hypothetical protein
MMMEGSNFGILVQKHLHVGIEGNHENLILFSHTHSFSVINCILRM